MLKSASLLKVLSIFSATELGVFLFVQTDFIPDAFISILAQLPVVAIVVWLWLSQIKSLKELWLNYQEWQQTSRDKDRQWLEHMLSIQRESLKESYRASNEPLKVLIEHITQRNNQKDNQLMDEMKAFSQQLAVNTATVNEIGKVDSIVENLIDRLEKSSQ